MSYPYLIQGSNIVVVIDNKPHTVTKTHISYEKLKEAIKARDWAAVKDLIEPKQVVLNYGNGNVTIKGEQMFWKGVEMHNAISTRMIQMLKEGFDIDPLVQFMGNLMSNPSKRAVTELYGFLEACNLPITPDGHFLAYKKVRENYLDCHSGTMDNSIGKVVEMERNQVDDNKDQTCSTGLHFCSLSYLSHFGGARTVIVKINPRDVVSIPSDYNNAKGRACRYEVVGEVENDRPEKAFDKVVDKRFTKAPAPVEGSSSFKKGYTAGYTGSKYYLEPTVDGQAQYDRGYAQGTSDAAANRPMKYRYRPSTRNAAVTATTPAQEYDKYGNPLSMTKDAIRKRIARRNAKLAKGGV